MNKKDIEILYEICKFQETINKPFIDSNYFMSLVEFLPLYIKDTKNANIMSQCNNINALCLSYNYNIVGYDVFHTDIEAFRFFIYRIGRALNPKYGDSKLWYCEQSSSSAITNLDNKFRINALRAEIRRMAYLMEVQVLEVIKNMIIKDEAGFVCNTYKWAFCLQIYPSFNKWIYTVGKKYKENYQMGDEWFSRNQTSRRLELIEQKRIDSAKKVSKLLIPKSVLLAKKKWENVK